VARGRSARSARGLSGVHRLPLRYSAAQSHPSSAWNNPGTRLRYDGIIRYRALCSGNDRSLGGFYYVRRRHHGNHRGPPHANRGGPRPRRPREDQPPGQDTRLRRHRGRGRRHHPAHRRDSRAAGRGVGGRGQPRRPDGVRPAGPAVHRHARPPLVLDAALAGRRARGHRHPRRGRQRRLPAPDRGGHPHPQGHGDAVRRRGEQDRHRAGVEPQRGLAGPADLRGPVRPRQVGPRRETVRTHRRTLRRGLLIGPLLARPGLPVEHRRHPGVRGDRRGRPRPPHGADGARTALHEGRDGGQHRRAGRRDGPRGERRTGVRDDPRRHPLRRHRPAGRPDRRRREERPHRDGGARAPEATRTRRDPDGEALRRRTRDAGRGRPEDSGARPRRRDGGRAGTRRRRPRRRDRRRGGGGRTRGGRRRDGGGRRRREGRHARQPRGARQRPSRRPRFP